MRIASTCLSDIRSWGYVVCRLYEEARRNRMRVEAQRNHNGAVLRQQVFFFDPNYENLAALAAQPMAVASGSGGGIGNGPSPTNLALGLDMGVGMNDSVYGGGAGGVGGQAVSLAQLI